MTQKTMIVKFSVLVLTTLVFTLTLHGISHAQTYTHIHIDAVNGTNAPGNGAAAKPYKSITYALLLSTRSNLPDPWHVHIHPGTYDADPAKPASEREIFPLVLRTEMIFEGTTTAEECIIDGQHVGESQVEILLGLDTEGVVIRNLTIQNMNRTNGTGGIVLNDPTGTKETPSRLEGCIVHNNSGGVWSNMPLILTENTFRDNGGAGVATTRSTEATNNLFSGNGGSGLYINGDSAGDISENTFQNNAGGVHITGTLKANVTHNTFNNNGGGDGDGGGLYAGTFTGDVTHNTFDNNSSRDGGGLYAGTFTGDVTHNTFDNNNSGIHGGGLYVRSNFTGDVTHNTFDNNNSGYNGGGLYVEGTFTGNVTHNTITRNTGLYSGGFWVTTLTGNITHNIFDSNSANDGGAFWLGSSTNTVEVFNNIFFNNTARRTGNSVVTRHATHFMNNLFMISDELSEGLSAAHTVWVNSPGCQFHNNIFSGVQTAIATEGALDLPITHNLFHNIKVDFVESGGNNLGADLAFWELLAVNASDNLEGDPLLVDPVTSRDFHLQAGSPAIDAGTNPYAPTDDFDGVARPVGATVDIGPYEYGGKPAPTPQTLEIVSGDNQQGVINTALANPFVVKVKDGSGSALAGVTVTFAVTAGGGVLSTESATTDADGIAKTTLTLGSDDGTNTVSVSVSGIQGAITFTATAVATEPPQLVGDVNKDGVVNIFDLVLVAGHFGQAGDDSTDVNADGVVNIFDLVLVAGAFGNTSAAPSLHLRVGNTDRDVGNTDRYSLLTATDVQGWLTQAQGLDLTDATVQRGIIVLQQLLAALTPKETTLLPNYPNPFNPETWIPYRLAKAADVTLTIYDLSGGIVRTLNVGHQIAAVYERRDKAIYWDGRTEFGERVASGLYFYHLTAGDYSATRKMVILK